MRNKTQGRTLQLVGMDNFDPNFSHGQFSNCPIKFFYNFSFKIYSINLCPKTNY